MGLVSEVDTPFVDTTATIFQKRLEENILALKGSLGELFAFNAAVEIVKKCVTNGKKILLCGNGGSSSGASHIVNDFVGHMYYNRAPMKAFSLVDNPAVLTALSNDYGYDTIFSRQVEAGGESGDVLIGISTSGNSRNVVQAAYVAKARNMSIIGLTNRSGGELGKIADAWLKADSLDGVCSEHIHLILLHTLCECVEASLYGNQPGWGIRS